MANEYSYNPNFGGDPIAPFLLSPIEQEILRRKKLEQETNDTFFAGQASLQDMVVNPAPAPEAEYGRISPEEELRRSNEESMNKGIAQAQQDAETAQELDKAVANLQKAQRGQKIQADYEKWKAENYPTLGGIPGMAPSVYDYQRSIIGMDQGPTSDLVTGTMDYLGSAGRELMSGLTSIANIPRAIRTGTPLTGFDGSDTYTREAMDLADRQDIRDKSQALNEAKYIESEISRNPQIQKDTRGVGGVLVPAINLTPEQKVSIEEDRKSIPETFMESGPLLKQIAMAPVDGIMSPWTQQESNPVIDRLAWDSSVDMFTIALGAAGAEKLGLSVAQSALKIGKEMRAIAKTEKAIEKASKGLTGADKARAVENVRKLSEQMNGWKDKTDALIRVAEGTTKTKKMAQGLGAYAKGAVEEGTIEQMVASNRGDKEATSARNIVNNLVQEFVTFEPFTLPSVLKNFNDIITKKTGISYDQAKAAVNDIMVNDPAEYDRLLANPKIGEIIRGISNVNQNQVLKPELSTPAQIQAAINNQKSNPSAGPAPSFDLENLDKVGVTGDNLSPEELQAISDAGAKYIPSGGGLKEYSTDGMNAVEGYYQSGNSEATTLKENLPRKVLFKDATANTVVHETTHALFEDIRKVKPDLWKRVETATQKLQEQFLNYMDNRHLFKDGQIEVLLNDMARAKGLTSVDQLKKGNLNGEELTQAILFPNTRSAKSEATFGKLFNFPKALRVEVLNEMGPKIAKFSTKQKKDLISWGSGEEIQNINSPLLAGYSESGLYRDEDVSDFPVYRKGEVRPFDPDVGKVVPIVSVQGSSKGSAEERSYVAQDRLQSNLEGQGEWKGSELRNIFLDAVDSEHRGGSEDIFGDRKAVSDALEKVRKLPGLSRKSFPLRDMVKSIMNARSSARIVIGESRKYGKSGEVIPETKKPSVNLLAYLNAERLNRPTQDVTEKAQVNLDADTKTAPKTTLIGDKTATKPDDATKIASKPDDATKKFSVSESQHKVMKTINSMVADALKGTGHPNQKNVQADILDLGHSIAEVDARMSPKQYSTEKQKSAEWERVSRAETQRAQFMDAVSDYLSEGRNDPALQEIGFHEGGKKDAQDLLDYVSGLQMRSKTDIVPDSSEKVGSWGDVLRNGRNFAYQIGGKEIEQIKRPAMAWPSTFMVAGDLVHTVRVNQKQGAKKGQLRKIRIENAAGEEILSVDPDVEIWGEDLTAKELDDFVYNRDLQAKVEKLQAEMEAYNQGSDNLEPDPYSGYERVNEHGEVGPTILPAPKSYPETGTSGVTNAKSSKAKVRNNKPQPVPLPVPNTESAPVTVDPKERALYLKPDNTQGEWWNPSGVSGAYRSFTRAADRRLAQIYAGLEALEKLAPHTLAHSAYSAFRRLPGVTKWAVQTKLSPIMDEMTDLLKKSGISYNEAEAAVYAKAAIDRNDKKKQDKFSGITNDDALALIKEVIGDSKEKAEAMDRLYVLIQKLNNAKLDALVEAGLLDEKTANIWKDKYKYYVPMKNESLTNISRLGRLGAEITIEVGRKLKIERMVKSGNAILLGKTSAPNPFEGMSPKMAISDSGHRMAEGRGIAADFPLSWAIRDAVNGIIQSEKAKAQRLAFHTLKANIKPDFMNLSGDKKVVYSLEDVRKLSGANSKKDFLKVDDPTGEFYSLEDISNGSKLSQYTRREDKEYRKYSAESLLKRYESNKNAKFSPMYVKNTGSFTAKELEGREDISEFISISDPLKKIYVENPKTGLNEIKWQDKNGDIQDTGFKDEPALGKMVLMVDGLHYRLDANVNNKLAMDVILSIQQNDIENLNMFFNALTKVNMFLSAMRTRWNPLFPLTNTPRDVQQMITQTFIRHGALASARAVRNLPAAVKAALAGKFGHKSEIWNLYVKYGGKIEFMDQNDIEAIHRKMDKAVRGGFQPGKHILGSLGEVVQFMNDTLENTVRLAAFKALVDAIPSDLTGEAREVALEKAALFARDVTVDFNAKGTKTRLAGAWMLFFNPGAQSWRNFITNFSQSPDVTKRAIATYMVAGLFGVGVGLFNRMLGGDDDKIEKNLWDIQPTYKKTSTIMISKIWSDKKGEYVTIPLMYGGAGIFVLAGQMMEGLWNGKENVNKLDLAYGMTSGIMGSLLPVADVTPTALAPIKELMVNEDWRGMPIVPEKDKDKYKTPESQKYRNETWQGYKDLAEWLNRTAGGDERRSSGSKFTDISPEVMAYMVAFLGGGVLTEIQRGINLATIGPGETGKNIPGYSKYNYSTVSDLSTRNVYDNMNDLNILRAELADIAKEKGGKEAAKFARENLPMIMFANMWDRVSTDKRKGKAVEGGTDYSFNPKLKTSVVSEGEKSAKMKEYLADNFVKYSELNAKWQNSEGEEKKGYKAQLDKIIKGAVDSRKTP